jgi:hypothetical protein
LYKEAKIILPNLSDKHFDVAMKTKLIFLFSLPRSGSTLLQRILAGHDRISTVSEPWILLPFCYACKSVGVFTEYNHGWAQSAVNEFIEQLPGKKSQYYQLLASFAHALYDKMADPGATYFLDKTPRYYLIIPQIAKMFPNAKFIFLFRDPVQILASIIQSFKQGKLRFHEHYVDLYRGPDLLVNGFNGLREKSIVVHFDQLLRHPELQMKQIFDYLELKFDDTLIQRIGDARLKGSMGDKDGTARYQRLEIDATDKWKKVFNTPYRKYIAKKFIKRTNPETLKVFGSDRQTLLQSIDDVKVTNSGFLQDGCDVLLGHLLRLFELPMHARRIRNRGLTGGNLMLHR